MEGECGYVEVSVERVEGKCGHMEVSVGTWRVSVGMQRMHVVRD